MLLRLPGCCLSMGLSWLENKDRTIIHLNVADFAVAVERVIDARLRDRPVIIAPQGASRAAVYDMSEEAYQAGVRKGMALRRAQRFCREAMVLPPHPDRYERAMKSFLGHILPYSPLIEAEEGNGHLFVDLTGTGRLFGPPPDVAWRIRKTVRSDLGFDPIWSVAPNKLVAKVATRVVKPTGEYIVEAGEESAFLHPLAICLLPGLEREDLLRFREFHVSKVGQAARWTTGQLEVIFGKRGRDLYQMLRGIDASPVLPAERKPPILTADHEFGDDTNDLGLIEAALYRLAEQVGRKLRKQGRVARRIGILLDYSDGVRVTRQKSSKTGTANDFKLFALAQTALELALTRRVRVRHLRLACDRLIYPPAQQELFSLDEQETQASENLVIALDQIRNRFGRSAIRMGRSLAADVWGNTFPNKGIPPNPLPQIQAGLAYGAS